MYTLSWRWRSREHHRVTAVDRRRYRLQAYVLLWNISWSPQERSPYPASATPPLPVHVSCIHQRDFWEKVRGHVHQTVQHFMNPQVLCQSLVSASSVCPVRQRQAERERRANWTLLCQAVVVVKWPRELSGNTRSDLMSRQSPQNVCSGSFQPGWASDPLGLSGRNSSCVVVLFVILLWSVRVSWRSHLRLNSREP